MNYEVEKAFLKTIPIAPDNYREVAYWLCGLVCQRAIGAATCGGLKDPVHNIDRLRYAGALIELALDYQTADGFTRWQRREYPGAGSREIALMRAAWEAFDNG